MTRELKWVALAALLCFGVVTIGAAYWAVVRADSLRERSDNARNVIAEQRIRRGAILDRDGEQLAYSEVTETGLARRVYPYPQAAAPVGYYSVTYGTAGIEAAFDADLRGDDQASAWRDLVDDLLHRAPQGSDVRSTVDLDVQLAASEAFGSHSGAVVVAHVPSGRVLAMVSQPNYDPNQLDAAWETLARDVETSPLLNRATAGQYQPGGALQTVVLAAMLAAQPDLSRQGGYVLNSEVPDVDTPVRVNGLELTCLPGTPSRPLTLAEAYLFGCPAPFARAMESGLTPGHLWERLDALGLLTSPVLSGFTTAAGSPPPLLHDETPSEELVAALTGQGDLTVTPLQMLQVIAAIANQGNAVPLHLVDAVRAPGSGEWESLELPARRPALLRADVASAVRLTMLQASAQSPYVSQARLGDLVIYGHSALAYGGPDATPYVWFAGFADVTESDQPEAVAVVVVIESEDDPALAAQVAGAALAAAVGVE